MQKSIALMIFFFLNSNFKNAIILVDIFTPFHLLSPLIVRITCLPGNCSSLFPRPDKQTKHVSQAVKLSRVGFKKQNLSTHLKNSFAGLLACSPQSHEQKKQGKCSNAKAVPLLRLNICPQVAKMQVPWLNGETHTHTLEAH